MPVSKPVKNLIFDLGGVILDLSVDSTLQAFAELSGIEKQKVMEMFLSSENFLWYEKGLITDEEFRDSVRRIYQVQATDAQIDACWNAMLLGIPPQNLVLLYELKNRYNVFLLSNTNTIHLDYVNQHLLPRLAQSNHFREADGNSLDVYFHRAYYSHQMKMRKPDPEIFKYLLDENNLLPEETLFLDDNTGNVAVAKSVGLQTIHVTTTEFILDYFR